jgi:hypothetical protein
MMQTFAEAAMGTAHRQPHQRVVGVPLAIFICGIVASLISFATTSSVWTVAFATTGVIVLGFGPMKRSRRLARDNRSSEPRAGQAELNRERRKLLVATLGVLAAVVVIEIGWSRYADTREQESATIEERLTAATRLLGDERLDVRLDAIDALEAVAHDSKDYGLAVMDMLTAYARTWAPRPIDPPPPLEDIQLERDVQAVLTVIEREKWADQWPEPEILPLTCFNLDQTDLRGARIKGTTRIPLCLSGSDLSDAKLNDARLARTDMRGADLTGANLSNANLENAQLEGANLSGAILYGADLRSAQGLTQAQIDSAIVDGSTKLPQDLSPPATPLTADSAVKMNEISRENG